jgi:hypothetical protein
VNPNTRVARRVCRRRSWATVGSSSHSVLSLGAPGHGTAHPLGNFSISRYTGIEVGRSVITLRYFVDMAEIPTFQELQGHGIPSDPAEPRVSRYVRDTAEALKQGLELEVGGRRLAL